MTPEQFEHVRKATELIQKVRNHLDAAMYYTEPEMPESEMKRVRQAYDKICEANDKL